MTHHRRSRRRTPVRHPELPKVARRSSSRRSLPLSLDDKTWEVLASRLVRSARSKREHVRALADAALWALQSGQLAGYAGDVWYPQPAPADHPWRTMPHHGMTPHISGSSLSAQARYAAGTREILESYFAGTPIREEYLIVDGGALAGTGAHSYSTSR